jgi:hypothetical protein
MAAKDTCRIRIIMLREVRKLGEMVENKITSPIRIICGAYFRSSVPVRVRRLEKIAVEFVINLSP